MTQKQIEEVVKQEIKRNKSTISKAAKETVDSLCENESDNNKHIYGIMYEIMAHCYMVLKNIEKTNEK